MFVGILYRGEELRADSRNRGPRVPDRQLEIHPEDTTPTHRPARLYIDEKETKKKKKERRRRRKRIKKREENILVSRVSRYTVQS